MNKYLSEIFDKLDKWRHFPSYQLERRVDVFFAIYLEEILEKKFGCTIKTIIPEFPVRIGNISEKHSNLNKSYKIDYLAVSDSIVYLIELKTDIKSRRKNQDWYLKRAKEINIPGLIDGIIKIYNATNQKRKYDNLITELVNLGWLKKVGKKLENTAKVYNISIVYIQPEKTQSDADIVSFDDIIEILREKDDDLSKRFAQSLDKWKVNPNI